MANSNPTNVDMTNLDVIALIDRSGSMDEAVGNGNTTTRWDRAQESLMSLARTFEKIDADGIDAIFFDAKAAPNWGVNSARVGELFAARGPGGSTNLAAALEIALSKALERRKAGGAEAKQQFIFVITDGKPDNQQAVAQVIVNATKQMKEDGEIAILLCQVGYNAEAKAFLTWLDDNLEAQGAKFDIVDACNLDDVFDLPTAELVAKAFND